MQLEAVVPDERSKLLSFRPYLEHCKSAALYIGRRNSGTACMIILTGTDVEDMKTPAKELRKALESLFEK